MLGWPFRRVNQQTLNTLQDQFEQSVGYSDHTLGNIVAVAAVAMGDGHKVPTAVEKEISKVVLKRIVARKPIKEGQIFSEDNICVKRNDMGLLCNKWDDIVGTVARRDYKVDEAIEG